MPFLKQFSLEIDQTTSGTTIDGYIIPLVDHEAYTNNSRLEIVSTKAIFEGLKQGKYTQCRYVDSMQTVPWQVSLLTFTRCDAYGSSDKGSGYISTDP